ncbi:hypothetical protein [uncultured Eubacterium sp.]|uniref:hypothetical protein n=1 Tax=uncultured Eubacterium sp. TaxID=165185 RepID=UPI00260B001B|nr:hypothetical protein [uncultured Eubacterium sp.]
MPTSESGVPTLYKGAGKNAPRYEMVAKHASEALDTLEDFNARACVPCKNNDLDEIKRRSVEYITYCQNHAILPTVTGLSARFGISLYRFKEWLKDTNYPDTQAYLQFVKTVFADMLEQSALDGSSDKIFSMFLLKSTHEYQETNKVVLEAKTNQYGDELTDDEILNIIEDD